MHQSRIPYQSSRVLLVGNDTDTCQMLAGYLAEQNMAVHYAADQQDMVQQIAHRVSDLVILGLQPERDDGLDLLRDIRQGSDIPVIIVADDRTDEMDRVIGLELGADDYITTPFGLRELLARMRAVLRRQASGCHVTRSIETTRGFRFAGWQLDRRRRELRTPSGEEVSLTKSDFALLIAFLETPGRPLRREHLLQATRRHDDIFDRSIDIQVLRLRRKLDPITPGLIHTKRGVGYRFTCLVTPL